MPSTRMNRVDRQMLQEAKAEDYTFRVLDLRRELQGPARLRAWEVWPVGPDTIPLLHLPQHITEAQDADRAGVLDLVAEAPTLRVKPLEQPPCGSPVVLRGPLDDGDPRRLAFLLCLRKFLPEVPVLRSGVWGLAIRFPAVEGAFRDASGHAGALERGSAANRGDDAGLRLRCQL